jgi:2-polyprenyl-6-methoxyphenol hydroxylase-like FAD-dependent oxidoreductase
MHVVVVGAGLGGLAAAVAADRAGHTVTVLERASALRETGAGIGLMPNGVLALDTLAPGTILTDVPVTALHDLGDHVELRTGGGPVRADVVVVADGAHSRLRAALLPDHPGLAGSGEYAARAIAGAAPHGVPLAVGEFVDHRTGDRFGCAPLADGGVYWFATWRVPSPADPIERHRWLRDRRADWHPATVALIDATPPEAVHVVETEQLVRPLPTLAVGRVALLGDAAHAMTPDLGQGACQAFEDAVALGAVLDGAAAADVPGALRDYDARRRPRTSALQRECRRMHRLLGLTGWRGRLRDAVLRRIPPALAVRSLAAQYRFTPEPGRRLATRAG